MANTANIEHSQAKGKGKQLPTGGGARNTRLDCAQHCTFYSCSSSFPIKLMDFIVHFF